MFYCHLLCSIDIYHALLTFIMFYWHLGWFVEHPLEHRQRQETALAAAGISGRCDDDDDGDDDS